MKRLLVHICCADCGLKLLDNLAEHDTTFYFYNPNIHPESEWKARKDAIKQVFDGKKQQLVMTNWTPKDYFWVVKKSAGRCVCCWRLRLAKTFAYAKEHGFDEVSSTLFTSIYHDQIVLRGIAGELAQQYGIAVYFPSVVNHCLKTSGFYKQNYCGCIYSLMEKYQTKFLAGALA